MRSIVPTRFTRCAVGFPLDELKIAADICVVSINTETSGWRGAVSPLTEKMVTDMKLETRRPSATPFALTAVFVLASFLEATDGLAFDATQNPHPTDFGFVVGYATNSGHATNADNATVSQKAMAVDPSGIPDCGNTGALTDTGSGFTCMTPAKGDTGATGPQGQKGDKGDAGSSSGGCPHVVNVCQAVGDYTGVECTAFCAP